MRGWLKTVGPYKVERIDGVDYGPADRLSRPRVVQHTTEAGFEGSLEKLRHVDSPTFLVGRDKAGHLRCVQLVALGRTAGALEHPAGTQPTNAACVAQIELVGYSQHHTWLPDAGVVDLLAHLYAVLHQETGVPLRHVDAHRDRKIFNSTAGVYGHADIPDQPAGHWDPGVFDYKAVFKAATVLLTRPGWFEAAAKLSPLWAWIVWRDHGAPAALRPTQIPARVPRSWWPRYLLHRRGV